MRIILQDFIIWTDQGRRNGIHAALKTTGEKIRGLVHPTVGDANDILAFDISHQPLVPGKPTTVKSTVGISNEVVWISTKSIAFDGRPLQPKVQQLL